MGNSADQLRIAADQLQYRAGKILRSSSIYQTSAWGNENQPDFLNQVLEVQTLLSAKDLMQVILEIEKEMGRIRTEKNAPRIIDIDILFYGRDIIHQPDLVVPHPVLHIRMFVLVPLNQLIPGFIHPVLLKTVRRLLKECPDNLDVKKF